MDDYERKCTANVALYCSEYKVKMFQDCNLDPIKTQCGITTWGGERQSACHEPCTTLGQTRNRCNSDGTMLFKFICTDIGYGNLGYDLNDYAYCTCVNDVCQ
jgi:hypothetical protein